MRAVYILYVTIPTESNNIHQPGVKYLENLTAHAKKWLSYSHWEKKCSSCCSYNDLNMSSVVYGILETVYIKSCLEVCGVQL
jgi:hypothetical protein